MHSRLLSLAFLMLFVIPASSPAVQIRRPPAPEIDPSAEQRARIEKEMAKKANQQRQENLKQDSEKLLKLATELNEYVNKSNENVLSMDVVKKAEEIEKLAHSVREKMKGS